MKLVDDRTEEQRKTHVVLWGGTDRFMSGWGEATGGVSYAFWACTPDDDATVERWIRSRGDIQRVRQVMSTYKSAGRGHCHIYVVDNGHPAFAGK